MNVRAEREAAGISQAEVAQRTGINQSKLSKIENGHVEPTTGEEALIHTALGTIGFEVEEATEDDSHFAPHCLPYPAAPKTVTERHAWMTQRNRNFQTRGVPAPESGTYGGVKKTRS